MKKVFVVLVALLACLPLYAQLSYNTVTATITDPTGNHYANAGYTISLVNNQGLPVSSASTPNGQLFNAQPVTGNLDTAGTFSVRLVPNTILSKPSGTQWKFVVTPPADSAILTYSEAWTLTFQTAISGDMDLSTQLSAVARPVNFVNLKTGQSTMSGMKTVTTPPSGACAVGEPPQMVADTGVIYTCQGGVWKVSPTAPGGAAGQTQINSGGTLSGIPGSVSDTNYGWKTQGGINYAKGFQTGAGNNGIANAAAANQTVIADPSYATTEFPGPFSFAASPFHYINRRNGAQTDFYHNPGGHDQTFNTGIYPQYGGTSVGQVISCTHDGSHSGGCLGVSLNNNSPGFSLGNNGFSTATGWSGGNTFNLGTMTRTRGIAESLAINQYKYSIGDNAAQYNYVRSSGGTTATSDEGTIAAAFNTFENDPEFTGPCLTGCTLGSTQITTGVANGAQGNGQYLTDTTAGAISANTVSVGAGLLASLTAIVTDATFAQSTAWGTIPKIDTPINQTPPFTTLMTFAVTGVTGTFAPGSLICFGGAYHEQARVVSASGTGTVTLTANLRMPHNVGSIVMQDGMCGNGLELTNYTYNNHVYLNDVIGSSDTHTLQVLRFGGGGTSAPTGTLTPPFVNLTTATFSTGTFVTATYNATGSTAAFPWRSQGMTYLITGADSFYDGKSCTGVKWTQDVKQFTCTIAGLVGSHTATSTLVATAPIPLKIWPIAETIDVQNQALSPPTVDGSLTLEPNIINFGAPAGTHNLYQTHSISANFKGISVGDSPNNPYDLFLGVRVNVGGRGAQGGGSGATANALLGLANFNPDSFYYSTVAAPSYPPNMITTSGAYDTGVYFSETPRPSESVIYVNGGNLPNVNDPAYAYNVFSVAGNNNYQMIMQVQPYNNSITLANSQMLFLGGIAGTSWTGGFSRVVMNDSLAFAPVTSPTPTVTASTTGGTLPDSTRYCYIISSRNNSGSDAAGGEACVTTGATGNNTNSILVTWPEVSGGLISNICRTTPGPGGELALVTLNGIALTRYIDTGNATGGACPGSAGASLASVDNPASVNFNSTGTTNKATVKASAGLTANRTATFPDATGTIGVIPTAASGKALCETAAHTLGHCTSVVAADGSCTCI